MSELKATTAQEIVREEKDCDYMDELFGGVKMPPTQVYLKSEADKVIAELEKENESLKYSVAALETDLAMSQRWRKYSEEKPEDEECVLVVIEGKVEKVRYRKFDGSFHNTHFSLLNHSVKWWLPLPKSPENDEGTNNSTAQ